MATRSAEAQQHSKVYDADGLRAGSKWEQTSQSGTCGNNSS
jgi:hypothetical protein